MCKSRRLVSIVAKIGLHFLRGWNTIEGIDLEDTESCWGRKYDIFRNKNIQIGSHITLSTNPKWKASNLSNEGVRDLVLSKLSTRTFRTPITFIPQP